MKVTRAQLDRERRAFVQELIAAGQDPVQAKRVALDMFAVYDCVQVDADGTEWITLPDDDDQPAPSIDNPDATKDDWGRS